VSPYRATRNRVRAAVGEGFVETYVDTPISVCETRDVKGFYAKAKAGEIRGFTGVDDPYEPPLSPEISMSTSGITAEENATTIVRYLLAQGFLLDDSRWSSTIEQDGFDLHVPGRSEQSEQFDSV
jgi:sulfate adenylyltransferase